MLAVATVGGLLFLQIRANPERNVQAGDHLMEEGDYERALNMYGRAVHRDPANEEYREKMKEALRHIRPTTTESAERYYQDRLALLNYEATHDRTNPEAHLRLIREFYDFARFSNSSSIWRQLADYADNMWHRLPDDEPQRVYARLYRGLAMYERADANTSDENDAAEEDLVEFLDAVPDSDLGWSRLIMGRLARAENSLARADARTAARFIGLADEAIEQGAENVDDGPALAVAKARRLIFQRSREEQPVADEQWVEAADRIAVRIRGVDDGFLVGDAVDVLRIIDRSEGLQRAVAILDDYLEDHPESLMHEFSAARLEYAMGEFDPARERAESLVQRDPLPVGLFSRVQHHLRGRAASLLVDIEFRRWELADLDERDGIAEQLQEDRDLLAQHATQREGDPIVIRADGKIAVAEGRFGDAASHFERLIEQGLESDMDVLRLSAISLEREGQLGLARRRMGQAFQQNPGNQWLAYQYARLSFQLQDFEDAQRAISVVMDANPHEDAVALQQAIEQAMTGEEAEPISLPGVLRQAYERFQSGDVSGARAMLMQAREDSPDNVEVVVALAQLSMMTGDLEASSRFVEEGLQLDSDNETLQRFSRWIDADDPVERIELVTESQFDDPAEQDVMTLVNLEQSADRWQRQLRAGLAPDGQNPDELQDQIDRARQRAESILAELDEDSANHPRLIEFQFERALEQGDWSEAQSLVDRAEQADADGAGGLVYQGRFQMQRGQYVDAVRTFISLTERRGFAAQSWRWLGMAYHAVGNYADAERAFDRAFEINPNDLLTLQEYGNMLLGAGDQQRALDLIRRARDLAPHNPTVRETWLQLEAQAGDRSRVLRERRELFEANPDNRENALRLADLLISTEPSRRLVLDDDGSPRYDGRRWEQMSRSRRQQLLEETARQWIDEGKQIVNQLVDAGYDDLDTLKMKARLLRREGEGREAVGLLEDAVENREGVARVEAMIALAEYYVDANQFNQAVQILQDARQDPADEQRLADRRLGDLLMSHGRHAQAAMFYNSVLEADDDRAVRLRMTESLIRSGQFDEARSNLDHLIDQAGEDMEVVLLEASLAGRRAAYAMAEGEDRLAAQRWSDQRELLERAVEMNPSSPTPHIQIALSYYEEYQRTGRRRLIDEAELSLGRAESLNPDQVQSRMIRAELRAGRGDHSGAARELGRVLERRPHHESARRRLVDIRVELGEFDQAIEVVEDAIDRQPFQSRWHDRLGDLLLQVGRYDDAVAAFQRSYELQPSEPMLVKMAESMLRRPDPDYQRAHGLLGQVVGGEQVNPGLRVVFAEASYGLGRSDDAIDQLERAYRQFHQFIEEGRAGMQAMAAWYAALGRMFVPDETEQAEEIVFELADGEPNAFELDQLAELWENTPDGGGRAAELQEMAVERLETVDESIRPRIIHRQGVSLYRRGEFSAAMQAFRRQTELNPADHSALNNLAYVLAKHLDQPDEALSHARRAVDMQPENASYQDTLGMILMLMGRYDEAYSTLRRAIELDEQSAAAHLHMAQLQLERADPDLARTHLERAEELDPDDEVREELERTRERINRVQ